MVKRWNIGSPWHCAILLVLYCTTIGYSAVEKKPYLLFEGNNNQMTVMWQLTNKQSCTIKWGKTDSYEMGEASTSEFGNDHQHKYRITDLRANTKYHYKVDGVGDGTFRTAPAAPTARTRFIVYGDTREDADDEGQNDHDSLAQRIIKRIEEQPNLQTAILFSGDYVNKGREESHWKDQFFNVNHSSLMKLHSMVPNIGVIGNHEGTGGSGLLKKYYPFPHADKDMHYWAFNYGSARVFMLDQFSKKYADGSSSKDYVISTSSEQYKWLESELAGCEREWKIVVFHRPGYSAAGGHDNDKDIQQYLQPLFEEHGVDFVLTGDNHYYSRAVVKGVQHITTGGGGAPLRGPDKNQPFIVETDKSTHYCELDLNGNVATLIARRANGTVIETVKVKHDNSAPEIINTPKDDTIQVGTEYVVELLSKDADEFEVEKWDLIQNDTEVDGFDGTFAWIPSNSDDSIQTFVATITDRAGESDTASWNIYVEKSSSLMSGANEVNHFEISSQVLSGKFVTTIGLAQNSKVAVSLYNVNGQQVYQMKQEELQSGSHTLTMPFHVSSGIYFLNVSINEDIRTFRLNSF